MPAGHLRSPGGFERPGPWEKGGQGDGRGADAASVGDCRSTDLPGKDPGPRRNLRLALRLLSQTEEGPQAKDRSAGSEADYPLPLSKGEQWPLGVRYYCPFASVSVF